MHWTCKLGFHGEREIVKRIRVNGWVKPVFGSMARNIPMELRFSRCKDCKTVFAYLDYGSDGGEVNPGFYARTIRNTMPKYFNDVFLWEVSKS